MIFTNISTQYLVKLKKLNIFEGKSSIECGVLQYGMESIINNLWYPCIYKDKIKDMLSNPAEGWS